MNAKSHFTAPEPRARARLTARGNLTRHLRSIEMEFVKKKSPQSPQRDPQREMRRETTI